MTEVEWVKMQVRVGVRVHALVHVLAAFNHSTELASTLLLAPCSVCKGSCCSLLIHVLLYMGSRHDSRGPDAVLLEISGNTMGPYLVDFQGS